MQTQDIFIIEPNTSEEANALKAFAKALKLKFEVTEKPYNPEFVAKIFHSEKQIAEGKTKRVKREDLKQYLGL
jgi:hypothetical protein